MTSAPMPPIDRTDAPGAPAVPAEGRPASPWLLFGWLAAIVLLCNPYRGVRHDGLLYLGQAMRRLGEPWTQVDLSFLGTTQDRYSIFSTIFGPMISLLGVQHAEIVGVLAANACLFLAAWYATRGLPPAARWGTLAALAVIPRCYGADHTFNFGEPFVTARSLAEPLTILALACLLNGRRGAAVAAGLVALLVHPLMALPGWLVAWRFLAAEDRRWNAAALLAVPVAALAWAGVPPFDGLATPYDPAWLDMVRKANGFVFIHDWPLSGWQQTFMDAALLAFGARRVSPAFRRVFLSVLWAMGACLAVSAVTVDVFHLRLPTQLQLWRVTWLGHFFAMVALAALVRDLWARPGMPRLAAAVLLLAVVVVASTANTAWIITVLAIIAIAAADRGASVPARMERLGLVACGLAALVISGVEGVLYVDQVNLGAESGIAVGQASAVPVILPALTVAIAGLAWWSAHRPSAWVRRASAVMLGLVVLVAITQWDQRTPWVRYIEQHAEETHPFSAIVPPRAQVLWTEELLADWALLHRASYFAKAQSAGALFSREVSLETERRLKVVAPIAIQTTVCRTMIMSGFSDQKLSDCHPDDVGVIDVCHLNAPGPDYVVLDSPLKAPAIARWTFRPTDSVPPTEYYLYDCRTLH